MTTPWLGHENLCPSQWRKPCSCPCPSCDEPLDAPAPDGCSRKAWHQASLQAELDRLERADPAVAKASAGLAAVYRNVGGSLPLAQIRDIYDLDRPYETSLDEDERRGH